VTQVVLELEEAVVVDDVVVDVVDEVVLVVELVLHGLLVQTGSPALEQTHVLSHVPVKVVPGVQLPVLPQSWCQLLRMCWDRIQVSQ